MELVWIATDPDSGRLSESARRSGVEYCVSRIEALRALGVGYSEVNWADRDCPRVALSFRKPYAVVHYWSAPGKIYLLFGGGVIDPHESIDLPILDDDAPFTGDFILSADKAWDLVKTFINSGFIGDMGEWREM
jgi:hypothetical protein